MQDNRKREYILPNRILDKSQGVENADALLTNKFDQIYFKLNVPQQPQIESKTDKDNLNLSQDMSLMKANKGDFIILDFGKELHGGIRIMCFNGSNKGNFDKFEDEITVRIRFGESVGECCAELSDEKNAINHHSTRDFYAHLPTLSDMEMGQTGFRFVRIDFLSENSITLMNVYAVAIYNEFTERGSFRCSDELVNKIYDTAKYTLSLNMQNYIWDGIKRDRLVWAGDIHPEALAITYVFGKNELLEKTLDFLRESYELPNWMLYPSYSMWWVKVVCDYYYKTGDKEFIERQIPYIIGLLKMFDGFVNEDGTLNDNDYQECFLDWPSYGNIESARAGTRFLMLYGLSSCEKMLKSYGYENDALFCRAIREKLLKQVDYPKTFKQVSAFASLAGVISPDEIVSSLIDGGAKGLSTYMSYYILRTISDAGKTDIALSIMKEYYGGMLSRGATSFWEDFNIEWLKDSGRIDEYTPEGKKDLHGDYGDFCYKGYRHSLCHGWACGPIQFLTEYILGVKVLDVGCKVLEIKPNLCGLEFAEGEIPTPYGIVKVQVKKADDKIEINVAAPTAVKIIK